MGGIDNTISRIYTREVGNQIKNKGGHSQMLFMTIYTYEPGNREAVVRRRAEKGAMVPPGTKIVGEWSALTGGRVFRLVEVEDSRSMAGAAAAWADLGKIEVIPVMPTEELMKLLLSK